MKNFLRAFIAVILMTCIASLVPTVEASAQRTKSITPVKDTLLNTDTTTVTFDAVSNDVVGLTFSAVKDTGTINLKIVRFGYNGKDWERIDSVTSISAANMNSSSLYSKLFTIHTTGGVVPYTQYKIEATEATRGKLKTIRGLYIYRSK